MTSINYKVKQGERWDLVAYKMYGDVKYMNDLIDANPSVPCDPVFPDGTNLVVPIIDDTSTNVINSNLPPWK